MASGSFKLSHKIVAMVGVAALTLVAILAINVDLLLSSKLALARWRLASCQCCCAA